MQSELKPCPFCGGRLTAWVANDTDSLEAMTAPMCECGATGPMYATRAEAIAAWNRRATPTLPDAALRAAEVMEIVAKATEGEWQTLNSFAVYRADCASGEWPLASTAHSPNPEADAAAIVAAVNFIRDGLPALMAAQEAEVARLREALQTIVDDCEADYPPSHGAIKYAARQALRSGK